MPVVAVIGAQWGDEGKGKIVDMLAERADVVVRFQGGSNAGHTVVNDKGKFALHLLPAGALDPRIVSVIGKFLRTPSVTSLTRGLRISPKVCGYSVLRTVKSSYTPLFGPLDVQVPPGGT